MTAARKLLNEVAAATVATMRPPVTNRDLTAAAKALRDQQATVARLQGLVDEQQAIVDKADPVHVRAAMQALSAALADYAENPTDRRAVAAAERKLAQAKQQQAEHQQAAELAQATIDGLQPRLDAARRELDKLRDHRNLLLRNYFETEQRIVAEEYRTAYRALQTAYSKLCAISDELEAVEAGELAHIGQDAFIPAPDGSDDLNLLNETIAQGEREAYRRKLAALEV